MSLHVPAVGGIRRDGRAAIDAARRLRPDLLVLDVMIPKVDGHDVCWILRQDSAVPVLMLTARSDEDDLLLALDHYMTKPYSLRELMAWIRTLLRRVRYSPPPPDNGFLRVGPVPVQPGHGVALAGAAPGSGTPARFGRCRTARRSARRVPGRTGPQ
ncbi:response regulator, partial [Streptomyces sp. NRRL S-15]|uniref:response regulator n=1 Tax=Streptomyces sp. NRRL S-15 TaxID=1463886 RepID=UPI0019018C10